MQPTWQSPCGTIRLYHADCLDVLPELGAGSVDAVIADLPYGTTQCKWDSVIPLSALWPLYKKLLKLNGAVVLTASQPFTSALVMSNPSWFRVEWIWEKNAGSNFGTVKFNPMKEHESVIVFSAGRATYNPIMEDRAASGLSRVKSVVNYNTTTEVYGDGLHGCVSSNRPDQRFPRSIQKFNRERGLHPTQKPVALFEYLVRTYTNNGETVLDNTMGSGTTGVACINTGRKFIGIEKDAGYFEIAKQRIIKALESQPLFAEAS